MKNIGLKDPETDGFEISDLPNEEASGKKWAKIVLFSLCGFLFSQLDCLWNYSPFSVAFISALPFEFCFSAFVGSALGLFTSLELSSAVKYTAAAFITCLFRLVKGKHFRNVDDGYINGIFALCAVFSAGLVHHFITEGDFTDLMFLLVESAVTFGSAVLFIKSIKTPVMRIGLASLTVKDNLCVGAVFCIFLLCSSGFTLERLSVIRILTYLLIMFFAQHKGVGAAATLGICGAMSFSVDRNFRFLFPAVAAGSLFCGAVAPFGQAASAIAFAVCSAGLCAFNGEAGIVCVIETVVASAVFVIIPSKYISLIEEYLYKKGLTDDKRLNNEIAENLNIAAENIYDITEIVCRVSEKLDTVINPEVNRLFSFLQQRVCDGCEKKGICWNKDFDSTASDVLVLAGIEKGKKATLKKSCLRFDLLYQNIVDGCADYSQSLASKMKLREMRKVMSDQFTGMGDFLKSTAVAVSENRSLDKGKSASVKAALQDVGISVDGLSYYSGEGTKITIEITVFDPVLHEQHEKIRTILEFVTKRHFEKAQIDTGEYKTLIVFNEKTAFKVQWGVSQKPLTESGVCGDTVTSAKVYGAAEAVILSDGMGTGSRAKIDSAMTCSVLEKLIESGFTFESALKIVNSTLIMKSTDESISTIDAVNINLYTGVADFYKAGAAITFVRSSNEITVIEGASLPVGIIRNVEFFKSRKQLYDGDIVLLLSDGAAGQDCGWIHDELLAWSTNNMQDLSCHIAKLSKMRMNEKTRDDITVAAVKLNKNR